MLKMAINGRIPLISVKTTDTVNVKYVLDAYLDDDEFHEIDPTKPKIMPELQFLYCISPGEDVKWEEWYQRICKKQNDQCIVVINPPEVNSCFFDAGTLQLPRAVLREFLIEVADKSVVSKLCATLGGLTLKEVGEICKMAMANHSKLTPTTVGKVRRAIMPSEPGLEQVDTDYLHYSPDPNLTKWMESDGKLFKAGVKVPRVIVPRGALFKGQHGTGKTMAARYMAHTWGVQLYRLDLAATLNKYIGESENNVRAVLNRVDMLAPCCLLIDEIEKLFNMGDSDSGVSLRILSTLLWWLQEHKSRVFTVITSNDDSSVPPELLRHGRLDEHFVLKGISGLKAKREFVLHELKSLKAPKACLGAITGVGDSMESQASLAHKARRILRQWTLQETK